MKRILYLVIFVAILIAALVTNPSKDRHKEVMHNAIAEASSEYVQNHTSTTVDNIFGGILSGVAGSIIKSTIDKRLEYHNYYVFSTCTMKSDGEKKLVSLGLFNQVITMDKDDVLEALGENQTEEDASQEEEQK